MTVRSPGHSKNLPEYPRRRCLWVNAYERIQSLFTGRPSPDRRPRSLRRHRPPVPGHGGGLRFGPAGRFPPGRRRRAGGLCRCLDRTAAPARTGVIPWMVQADRLHALQPRIAQAATRGHRTRCCGDAGDGRPRTGDGRPWRGTGIARRESQGHGRDRATARRRAHGDVALLHFYLFAPGSRLVSGPVGVDGKQPATIGPQTATKGVAENG